MKKCDTSSQRGADISRPKLGEKWVCVPANQSALMPSTHPTISASKSYQKHKDVLFEDKAFYQLKNAQAIAVAYDGINPLPPTYCFLKPDFMPHHLTWFEQQAIDFDPRRAA